jgi:hypothetical protein
LAKLERRWDSMATDSDEGNVILSEMGLINMIDYENWSHQMDKVSGPSASRDIAGWPIHIQTQDKCSSLK